MKVQNIVKLFTFALAVAIGPVQAIQVTVSVPPLAGLLKPLLDESDQLVVLLKPGVSPHGFQLKPSHLKSIHSSDAVFSVGTPVDGWLEKTLDRVKKPIFRMSELQGLQTLPIRSGGIWLKASETVKNSEHEHGHDHDEHEDDSHSSEAHGHDEGDHHGHDHDHSSENWPHDGHIWLSMINARLFVEEAAELIKQLKPQQAAEIEQKKLAWLVKLAQLDQNLITKLAPVKDRPYVVLHDAYQYFEQHYQLNGVGSVRLNPEITPSLKRVQQLRDNISQSKISCVFKEPQFPGKRVLAVVRGLDVKVGSLDPMGSFVPGSDAKIVTDGFLAYDVFLDGLANSMVKCLTASEKR